VNGFLPPVSDEDLHGFVDGETTPERRDAIAAFLAASPADAARVEAWRRQNEAIRAAFARVETERVPLSWSLSPVAKHKGFPCKLLSAQERLSATGGSEAGSGPACFWRKHQRASLLVAGFASGIIVAVGAQFLVQLIGAPEPAPTFDASRGPQQAAEADSAFLNRTTAALQAYAPAPAAAKPAVSPGDKTPPAQGQTALILPNLSGAGLKLTGVRAEPSEFDQMFCLFYAKASDAAVALCVEKAEDAGASGFRKVGRFPSSAISWRQRGAKYALAGALADVELRNLAERAHAEVEAFDIR